MSTCLLISSVHVMCFYANVWQQTVQGFLQYLYRLLMDWGQLLVFQSFWSMKLSHAGVTCYAVKKCVIYSMCMHYCWGYTVNAQVLSSTEPASCSCIAPFFYTVSEFTMTEWKINPPVSLGTASLQRRNETRCRKPVVLSFYFLQESSTKPGLQNKFFPKLTRD